MKNILLKVNTTYFLLIVLLGGGWSSSYITFSPSELTFKMSWCLSVLFFVYYIIMLFAGLLKKAKEEAETLEFKYYLTIPICLLLCSLLHFEFYSKGLPYALTPLISNHVYAESVIITNKGIYGKSNNKKVFHLKGHSVDFPVSTMIYDQYKVGQVINISVQESILGAKIRFNASQ